MTVEPDVEVLVVGSGIAGLAAANAAWEAGARRLLVAEAEGVVGGSSRLSGGIVMGAGTRFQRALGIDDDADSLFHDYLALNQWQVDAAVVRRFCEEAGPTIEWLADHGVQFEPELVVGGDEREPRSHAARGRGQAIVDALAAVARERGIDVALGRRVDRLLVDGGHVVGVAVGDDEVRAGAVVLATGGFGANRALLAELYPDADATGDWLWYIGADGSRGDALALGAEVEAQVVGHNRGLRLPHPNFGREYEAYLPGWMVVVDRQGRRVVNESAPYGVVDGVMGRAGNVVYALFDDAALRFEGRRKQYKDPVMDVRLRTPNWTPDRVDEQVARGAMHAAATIEELAGRLGLPADVLAGTVERYNGFAAERVDREFLKDPAFLAPVATPPFYGAELRPATLCLTSCGLRIDPDANVLDRWSRPVPGLFAAGECTGGVLGDRYVGSGNSLGNGATMGRVAGRSAARVATSP